MRNFLLLLLSLFLSASAFSQRNTYVGIEGAAAFDIYDYADNGVQVKNGALLTAYYGISFRHEITDMAFLELGIFRKHYDEGIGFRSSPGYTSSNAFDAWFVVGRIGSKIALSRSKLLLVPVVGYGRMNSEFNFQDASLSGSSTTRSDTITYNVQSKMDLAGGFPLIQTSIGLETLIRRTLTVTVSANYFTGFTKVIEQDIQYIHNGAHFTAKGLSKGEFFALSLGIKYPLRPLSRKNPK